MGMSVFARVKEPLGGAYFGSGAQQEQFARLSTDALNYKHKIGEHSPASVPDDGTIHPLVYVGEGTTERLTRQGRRELGSWSFHTVDQSRIIGGGLVAPETTIFKKGKELALLLPQDRTALFPVLIAAPDLRELQGEENVGAGWGETYNYDLRIPYITLPWLRKGAERRHSPPSPSADQIFLELVEKAKAHLKGYNEACNELTTVT